MMKMEMQQIYKGDEMNYLKYIIYHNCDKGRIVVRHTQRFFTSYEEAKENAKHWIDRIIRMKMQTILKYMLNNAKAVRRINT